MSDQVQGAAGQAPSEASKERLIEEKAQAYWRKNVRLISILLVIWGVVSYLCGFVLAVPLQNVMIGQLPFGFWFAQQGAIVTFVILILVYAIAMDRLDREFDLHE